LSINEPSCFVIKVFSMKSRPPESLILKLLQMVEFATFATAAVRLRAAPRLPDSKVKVRKYQSNGDDLVPRQPMGRLAAAGPGNCSYRGFGTRVIKSELQINVRSEVYAVWPVTAIHHQFQMPHMQKSLCSYGVQ
jgi:hypothetical protein